MTRALILAVAVVGAVGVAAAQESAPAPAADGLHAPFDDVLDVYVRDGLVYYRALRQERARLDRYVASLATAAPRPGDRAGTLAFWINAYNAFVLRTVIDFYPIGGSSRAYPHGSIRQIPGAFEQRTFRAAGRAVTLDQIEQDILVPLGDPRALLALGRGAMGGGRLRSEAYTADRIEAQLAGVAREVVDRRVLAFVDVANGVLSVSPLFSWRESAFVAAYAGQAPAVHADRSPVERALLGLITPFLVRSEAEFLAANRFRLQFHDFDWRLNDLTGR